MEPGSGATSGEPPLAAGAAAADHGPGGGREVGGVRAVSRPAGGGRSLGPP